MPLSKSHLLNCNYLGTAALKKILEEDNELITYSVDNGVCRTGSAKLGLLELWEKLSRHFYGC